MAIRLGCRDSMLVHSALERRITRRVTERSAGTVWVWEAVHDDSVNTQRALQSGKVDGLSDVS